MLQNEYRPIQKSIEQFLKELQESFDKEEYSKKITPMTLEGCVVRISDIIAYIGRDIEDAILVGSIKREDIPKEITDVLGDNNSDIVDFIIKDIIINSYGKGYISFSKEVYEALLNLKNWNYKHIYKSKEAAKNKEIIEEYFYKIFNKYREYLNENNKDINVSKTKLYEFINARSKEYKENTSKERMIIDYMSGHTDSYFLNECEYNFVEFKKVELYK